jgi:hypothetical protein
MTPSLYMLLFIISMLPDLAIAFVAVFRTGPLKAEPEERRQ